MFQPLRIRALLIGALLIVFCLILSCVLLVAGCKRAPTPAPSPLPGGGARPAQAIELLAQRLRADDLEGYVRVAVPPELVPSLETAWAQGRSRWPLTELPLDERLPAILAALAADDSEARLQALFERQFAGADRELKAASASLGLFGVQYMQTEGDFSDREREHYSQAIQALSVWGASAPLPDPELARQAIARLAAAARKTGLASDADLRQAGMFGSLRRLAPFMAAFKRSLADYGLDIDRSLDSVQAGLIDQTGDTARVRVRYRLGGQDIDTVVAVERRDGRWYLTDLLRHAEEAVARTAAASTGPQPPPAAANAAPARP